MKKLICLSLFAVVLLTGCASIRNLLMIDNPEDLARNITIGFVMVENHISEEHKEAVFNVYDAFERVLSDNKEDLIRDQNVLKTIRTKLSQTLITNISNEELRILSVIVFNKYWSTVEENIKNLELDSFETVEYLVKFNDSIATTYVELSKVRD